MSLDWNLKHIKGWKELCYFTDDDGKRRLNAMTEILVFATLSVGLGEITKKNVDQWELRLEILSQMGIFLGVMSDAAGELQDCNPSRADIEAHIGLSTNVFPNKSLVKFKSDRMKQVERDAQEAIYRRRKELRNAS